MINTPKSHFGTGTNLIASIAEFAKEGVTRQIGSTSHEKPTSGTAFFNALTCQKKQLNKIPTPFHGRFHDDFEIYRNPEIQKFCKLQKKSKLRTFLLPFQKQTNPFNCKGGFSD